MLRERIAVALLIFVLSAVFPSALLARDNRWDGGVSVSVLPPPYAVAGRPTGYSIQVANGRPSTWHNVILRVDVPNQTIVERFTTIGESSPNLPRAFSTKFSPNRAEWGLKQLTPHGNFTVNVWVT